MTRVDALLNILEQRDIHLVYTNNKVIVEDPHGNLTEDVLEQLRARKAE
ncbi:TubC N-terminal docking domain-related protein, partial [Kordiimonas aquimaris]